MRKGAESSPYGSQSYQFSSVIGISYALQIWRKFDSETLNRTCVRSTATRAGFCTSLRAGWLSAKLGAMINYRTFFR
jgi:hypothetical protein